MLTSNHVNNEVIKFRRQVISDFLRRSRFDPFVQRWKHDERQ